VAVVPLDSISGLYVEEVKFLADSLRTRKNAALRDPPSYTLVFTFFKVNPSIWLIICLFRETGEGE